VTPGSVIRDFTTALFSRDGAWLFAGSASGDVAGVNVVRRAIQTTHPVCSLGVGALLFERDDLLVGGGDGSVTLLRPLEMRTAEKPRAVLPGGVTSLCRTADGRGLIAGTEAGRIARCAPASLPSPYLVLARPLLPSSSRYCPHLHARAGWRPAPWRSPSSQSATSEPCAASRTAATTSPPARLAARQGVTAVNISHEGRFLVTGAPCKLRCRGVCRWVGVKG